MASPANASDGITENTDFYRLVSIFITTTQQTANNELSSISNETLLKKTLMLPY